MTLSEYDKAQFESLTADFAVEDATALKKMEKRDKASEMSFIPVPHLHDVLLAAAFVSLFFMIAGRVTGNDSQMFAAGASTFLCLWVSLMVTPVSPQTTAETDDNETQKQ